MPPEPEGMSESEIVGYSIFSMVSIFQLWGGLHKSALYSLRSHHYSLLLTNVLLFPRAIGGCCTQPKTLLLLIFLSHALFWGARESFCQLKSSRRLSHRERRFKLVEPQVGQCGGNSRKLFWRCSSSLILNGKQ